ncbi:hypothetical protein FPQ18DRAFT_385078 [Pyronema domesticum]|nr:hypothetical protein FPQ18DRAFT_385078 [Pyronema domesticum]
MPMVPVDIPTLLTDLELDSSPDMEKLMAIVPGIRAAVSSYGEQSCKWEFTAQKRLENLVGQLKLHNTNLEQLRSMHIQHKVVRIRSFFLKYEGSIEYQNTATLSSQKEILYFMVPFPRNWDFIGESKVLSWFKDKDPSVNRDSSCVALVGLAGIRKTQDVLEFAYEYKNLRPVYWINCENATQFEQDYHRLASLSQLSGLDSSDLQYIGPKIKRWPENPDSGNWILILDYADDKFDFFPESNKDGVEVTEGLAKHIPHLRK